MFQLAAAETLLRLEHRHNDGTWSTLEPRPNPHDPAESDPERGWAAGRIFVCTVCDEEVRIVAPESEKGPDTP
jgi:hypothetical protein